MRLFIIKRSKHGGKRVDLHTGKRHGAKVLLTLCLALILGVCTTIGVTFAFMQEKAGTVTNTFKAGEITYTLNLEGNAQYVEHKNGEVTMPSAVSAQTVTDLSVVFTADKTPSLQGYTFDGWYYDDDCKLPHTAYPGTSITVRYGDACDSNDDANKVALTLYAKWKANEYEVVYNGNGATTGSMGNSQHTYDVEAKLTKNDYSRTGYRFLGWSEDSKAVEATYTDEASVMNLASENGVEVVLYAVWEQMDFVVTFDTQVDGLTADPTKKTVTYTEAYGELPVVKRTGYSFVGWTLEKNGGTQITDESIVEIADDHILYAQWTANTYTLSFDTQTDKVANPASVSVTYDSTYKNLPVLTREGYTFSGWTTTKTGNAYVTNGEKVTTAANHTLYAQWDAKTYTIEFYPNGGQGTMASQVVKYDNMFYLRPNAFTKDDHSFIGWAEEADKTKVVYIDKQELVNLLESGTLKLYAVWAQDTHTVTFDYNSGTGVPPTKEVLYGQAYGTLPTYPTATQKLFTGWYTEPTGGTRVYPETIVNRKDDHTLYAHWESSPANDVIKNLTVKNNPDDNGDGLADDVYLTFECSSSFEKFNVPIKGLVPGQQYKLTYTASNNASFGDGYSGYKNSRYGSYILPEATNSAGNINDAVAQDILATWEDRKEADGSNDGSQAAINDSYLNGPWKDRTITFTATQETMYWAWEFGLIQDGIMYEYNITDIELEPVIPEIHFANKSLIIYTNQNPVAKIVSDSATAYTNTFVFDGAGYAETMYFPITGLTTGTTYTITLDHSFNGHLIHDTASFQGTPTYQYGFGIMSAAPTVYGSKMENLGTYISNTHVMPSVTGKTESVTLTFTATGNTAYWVWNMANCSDSYNCTIDIKVTNFSAKHAAGGNIAYYTAASNAGSAITLDLMPEEEHEIQFVWDGIDDTNMDIWYPVDEQYPVAGDNYELAFEPLDGYTMAEIITVMIDDVAYEVYTNGQIADGMIVPVYDPENNILTIPAELLTTDTVCVSVTASAIAKEGAQE